MRIKKIFPLFIILVCLSDKAYACYHYFPCPIEGWFEITGGLLFCAFLIFISSNGDPIRDTNIFFTVIVLILIFAHIFYHNVQIFLANEVMLVLSLVVFTAVYLFRVHRKAEKQGNKYRILLVTVPVLIWMWFNFPLPMAGTNHLYCEENLKKIGNALEYYRIAHQGKYPLKLKDLEPECIKKVPFCEVPIPLYRKSPRYRYYQDKYNFDNVPYRYEVDKNRERYSVFCAGNNHKPNGRPVGFPRYTSIEGLIIRND